MAELTRARVTGAEVGSGEVSFAPGPVKPGEYRFDVSKVRSSAGSVTLVLQTLLPALALASGPSRIAIVGGTHVPWSPPYHFIERSFLPAVSRMGVDAETGIARWGFYPAGGGLVEAKVKPSGPLSPADFTDRGALVRVTGLSAVANLPVSIARRQASSAVSLLTGRGMSADIELVEAQSVGQGTFIYLSAEFERMTLGFSALGERGKRAEVVGEEAASALIRFVDSGACVEERLADQLLIYMALAKGASKMTVSRVTRHLLTNAWVINQFLPDVYINVKGEPGERGEVEVKA